MPTKQKRHVCHKCGRKIVKSKIKILKKPKNGRNGKYICKDCIINHNY